MCMELGKRTTTRRCREEIKAKNENYKKQLLVETIRK